LFEGDRKLETPEGRSLAHLAPLVQSLIENGTLSQLGVPTDEIGLLQDCVAVSHWSLVGSDRVFVANRGSRPGDGLADILFGALFSIGLRHVHKVCRDEGWGHCSGGSLIGSRDTALSLGWADDLAVLTDYDSPTELQQVFPRVAEVVLSTLRLLRFRVNLGAGKTEAMLHIQGAQAKRVRGELLSGDACLPLPGGDVLKLAAEYRYLGVVQTVKDTGRRDMDLNARRAQTAWAHARALMTSDTLPWPLKQAWLAGRVLPAAYATLATCIAVSQRATAPLAGFFERAARTLLSSWRYGHRLTRPVMLVLLGVCSPEDALVVARVRLTAQLLSKAPIDVWELIDAAWNRATPWCSLLADACREVLPAVGSSSTDREVTILNLRRQVGGLHRACKYLSRWGTQQRALTDLWHEVACPRTRRVLGCRQTMTCGLCGLVLPSHQALAAHIHRKHSVVNQLTRLTNGTVCLWCNTEQHSTDRLKYHLRTTPGCVHGLRVVVGESYEYGTGTKRTGARAHRGLPAIRLPGPLNATPAQRRAAAAGRACEDDALREELQRKTGATCVYDWPASPAAASPGVDNPGAPVEGELTATAAAPSSVSRWFTLVPMSAADAALADGVSIPSPYWPGLFTPGIAWQLPSSWHRFWRLWSALEANTPWHRDTRSAFGVLRAASSSHAVQGPSSALSDLLAATVSFRLACMSVAVGGLLWMYSYPSKAGRDLLGKLLPSVALYSLRTPAGPIFAAVHHHVAASPWKEHLFRVCSPYPTPKACSPLRATFVYSTRSPNRD